MSHDYIRDGAEIYRRSFAIIRAEADLARFPPEEEKVAVRVIHAAGMVEVASDLVFAHGAVAAAKAALEAGAPVICDSRMVANGITRARLPASNEIVCTLDDPSVPTLALTIGNTRTAAAMMLWGERLKGAVVAIGNAPTALFHLFEMLDAGAPRPAAVGVRFRTLISRPFGRRQVQRDFLSRCPIFSARMTQTFFHRKSAARLTIRSATRYRTP